MILRREITLRTGRQYRFQVSTIDLRDVFRGRYLGLRIAVEGLPIPSGESLEFGQKVYAIIEETPDGFARLSRVTLEEPKAGAYIACRVQSLRYNKVHLAFPFDRYYLEEKAQAEIEAACRRDPKATTRPGYVTLRIRSGFAVLEDLYVDGKPVKQLGGQATQPPNSAGPRP